MRVPARGAPALLFAGFPMFDPVSRVDELALHCRHECALVAKRYSAAVGSSLVWAADDPDQGNSDSDASMT